MKKLVLTVVPVLLALVTFGQKVDLDRFNFTFEYRDLPHKPLSPDYKTFSVSVAASSGLKDNYGESGLQDAININGLKKITEGKGHIIVGLNFEDVVFTSSDVKERVDIQKDKDGKETGRTYYYWAEVGYTWNGKVVVKDYKEAAVNAYAVGTGTTPSTWKSSEYNTYKAAADYYNNNKYQVRTQLLREQVKAALESTNSSLNTDYGYPDRKEYEILWILDSKKHPETAAQKATWETFKAAVANVKPNELTADTKAKFEEVIKYFDAVPTRFTTDDKGDKKLRYAAFYNKAKIYLYLDNPQAAIKEAEALIANGYDDGDGKRIKKEAEALIELFQKNGNATSRHFTVDASGATAPAIN